MDYFWEPFRPPPPFHCARNDALTLEGIHKVPLQAFYFCGKQEKTVKEPGPCDRRGG